MKMSRTISCDENLTQTKAQYKSFYNFPFFAIAKS